MFINLNDVAHHAAIILETAVPVRVAEHQIRRAVGAVLIGGVEETAKIGMNPEHVEVVARRCKPGCQGGIVARVQTYKNHIESREGFEAVVAIAQIDVVGIRLESTLVPIVSSV